MKNLCVLTLLLLVVVAVNSEDCATHKTQADCDKAKGCKWEGGSGGEEATTPKAEGRKGRDVNILVRNRREDGKCVSGASGAQIPWKMLAMVITVGAYKFMM